MNESIVGERTGMVPPGLRSAAGEFSNLQLCHVHEREDMRRIDKEEKRGREARARKVPEPPDAFRVVLVDDPYR